MGLALNAIASLLFIPLPLNTNKSLDGTLFQWFIQHPLVIMVAGIFILLLVFIIYLGSRFEIREVIQTQQPSEHIEIDADQAIRNRYLNQIRINTELLTLKGIPAGLISEAVRLDEVFIPLQFRLNRPRTDYPLTERELVTFREQRSLGKLSAIQEHMLITAEKDWQYLLKKGDRISMAELWQQFTDVQPTI
nr:hypothetical protein [Ktedonobacteraceae bacterium]